MLQAGLLAIWACLTWPFLLLTREQTVGFAASANLAVGVIVYYNSENGVLELGGLPQILFLGVLGLLLGRYAQRRYRLFNSAVLPQVSRRALQAKRFLRASLLCCGFIWGSAIAFAVLPKEHLRDFLRSLGGENLVIEGTTEYAVRMALWTFTLIGFLFAFWRLTSTEIYDQFSVWVVLCFSLGSLSGWLDSISHHPTRGNLKVHRV